MPIVYSVRVLVTHVILIYDSSCARTRICERLNYAKGVAVETTAELRCIVVKLLRCITYVFLESAFLKKSLRKSSPKIKNYFLLKKREGQSCFNSPKKKKR